MMTASCCGLPVCLSGVHILPEARSPYWRSHRHGSHGFCDAPNLASDFHASSSIGVPLTQPTTTAESDVDGTVALTMTDYPFKTEQPQAALPRFTIAKEIADLDRRREAIKKQRFLQNAGSFMEEYRFIREQNDFLLARFENQQSRNYAQSDCINRNTCAKAA